MNTTRPPTRPEYDAELERRAIEYLGARTEGTPPEKWYRAVADAIALTRRAENRTDFYVPF